MKSRCRRRRREGCWISDRGRVAPGRKAAIRVLEEVGRGRRLDLAFGRTTVDLDARDRAWVKEVTSGVQRLRGRLDFLLDLHVSRGIESLAPRVLEVLRIGAYQLLYMGGVPDYAAVSQAVEQARAVGGKGAAGLVNAVLRSLGAEGGGEERFPDADSRPVEYLVHWGSHPAWLVERWLKWWSFEEVHKLIETNNTVPRLTVRPYGTSAERTAGVLAEAGIPSREVGRGTDGLEVDGLPRDVLSRSPMIVQDPAATLVALHVDVDPGSTVLDLCAAPGGKSLVLSETAGYVLAADASARRLELIEDNVDRLEAQTGNRIPMGLVVADAGCPPAVEADAVLLDAPCSATGTLRKSPDAKWRLSPKRLASLLELQERLLEGAAGSVRRGGVLVYSTCSLEVEENRRQVLRFLERHPEFALEPGSAVDPDLLSDDMLEVTPQLTGFDGAIAARMRKA